MSSSEEATVSRLALAFKGKPLKAFVIEEGDTFVGSDPACTIHIDSLAIAPRHICIHLHAAAAVLVAQDEGPDAPEVHVNGRKVLEHELKPGDAIQIGKHTLTFLQERSAAPAQSALRAQDPLGWVQIMNGTNVGRTMRLDRPLLRIGKTASHCALISRRDGGYFLSSVEGSEAPRVGGELVREDSRALADGDIIEVGDVQLQFFLEGE